MAWRSSGSTNEALIGNLFNNRLITSELVKDAMLGVDRAHYAPSSPYEDSPQRIGHSATISAPHMHAHAAESLLPFLTPTSTNPSPRVLDIGSGSGYLTHVLANLVGPRGTVTGVDHIDALVDLSRTNMDKSAAGRDLLESGRAKLVCGDGRKGWPEGAPYDAIHVGAAAAEAHKELLEQLKAPGRMFIPIGDEGGTQYIWTIEKDAEGKVTRTREFGVMYVPLTDKPGAGR